MSGKAARLYLTPLKTETTEARIEKVLSKYGVRNITIKRRGHLAEHCFAFVTTEASVAQRIIDEGPHDIDGVSVHVEHSRERIRSPYVLREVNVEEAMEASSFGVRKLFLGGLASGTSSADLRVRARSPRSRSPLLPLSSLLDSSLDLARTALWRGGCNRGFRRARFSSERLRIHASVLGVSVVAPSCCPNKPSPQQAALTPLPRNGLAGSLLQVR